MSRVLMLLLAVVVFFWLLRRSLGSRMSDDTPAARKGGQGAATAVPDLVPCAHCGVLLPKNEALAGEVPAANAAGRFFCSEEHRRLGVR